MPARVQRLDVPVTSGSHAKRISAAKQHAAEQRRLRLQEHQSLRRQQKQQAAANSSFGKKEASTHGGGLVVPSALVGGGVMVPSALDAQRQVDRAMIELRGELGSQVAERRRVQMQEPEPPLEAELSSFATFARAVDPGRAMRQREMAFEAQSAAAREKAAKEAQSRSPHWWPRELKLAPPRRRLPSPNTVVAADRRLFEIKGKSDQGEPLTDLEKRDAAAILELRDIWEARAKDAQAAAQAEQRQLLLPPIGGGRVRPQRNSGQAIAALMVWNHE